ncbi:hypothetical protein DL768_009733 [Monosporascus sp. mg162]|nr:hypothetical protein DL768_009733 [Monosporascus sp. mg162]
MIPQIVARGLIILPLAAIFGAATPIPAGPWDGSGNGTTQYYQTQKLTWGPCPARFASAPNVTCATYPVPLDWDHANSTETITLGMLRLPASGDPSRRIGSLFINPGGPGVQATDVVARLATAAGRLGAGSTAELLERFDVIGLDPRGVGLSTPVRCDAGLFNERASLFPRTRRAFGDLLARNAALGESCRALSGRLVDFVDTASAARDHEAVRLALGGGEDGGGGEKASFLGLSYGTQLFSQYAELFPEGVRAMVLDGAVQHSQSEPSNLLIESAAYETTLQKFFEWCDSANSSFDCAVPRDDGGGGGARQVFLDVLAKARDAPIPAPGCDDGRATGCRSSVTEEEARFNAQGLLLEMASWPALGRALLEARDDANATLLSRAQPIAVGDDYEDSYLFGGTAVQCQDWTHATASTWAGTTELQILGAAFAPLTRGASQSYRIQASCAGWPSPQRNPERPLSYAGGAGVLLVNSVYDPSTSYVWAVGLRGELGERAVLLTRDGAGHTSWFLGGEATDAINTYLVNLTLPEPWTVVDS